MGEWYSWNPSIDMITLQSVFFPLNDLKFLFYMYMFRCFDYMYVHASSVYPVPIECCDRPPDSIKHNQYHDGSANQDIKFSM